MSTSVLTLNRRAYLTRTTSSSGTSLDYLSAKYKNIKDLLPAKQSYTLSDFDESNLPGLAYKFYGDTGYWWIIGLYNGIIDPISGLTPGTVLQLPSLADINSLLTAQDSQKLTTSSVTI